MRKWSCLRAGKLAANLSASKLFLPLLRRAKILQHFVGFGAVFATKINHSAGFGIEHVVALVLRVRQPEMRARIFRRRMDLERQIAPSHGVEKVEADGELRPEAAVDRLPEEFARMVKDQINGGNLDFHPSGEFQQEGVLLGNAIEAPCVVGRTVGQIAHFSHPLPSPRARIKERHHAERPGGCG